MVAVLRAVTRERVIAGNAALDSTMPPGPDGDRARPDIVASLAVALARPMG